MTNTFLNKVQAERRVLGMVNAHTRHALQLTGLSGAAIDDWQRRQRMVDMTAVVSTLRELAVACQALSDRSHETFRPIERVASEQIEAKCARLELALKATFEKG